jgi:hypothetical protein
MGAIVAILAVLSIFTGRAFSGVGSTVISLAVLFMGVMVRVVRLGQELLSLNGRIFGAFF